MSHQDHPHDAAAGVEVRLRAEVPQLTPLELDRLRLGVDRRIGDRGYRRSGLRARLSIVSMLVAGLLMTGTGGALAISGISGSGSAASQQYPDSNTRPTEKVLGAAHAPVGPATVQAVQQEASSSKGGLPFTGYLAIPVLLCGVALLSFGLVLRSRARAPGGKPTG